MTKAQHNYTNPFRKDRVKVRCCMCEAPATFVVTRTSDGQKFRVCEEHMPYVGQEEEPDV